MDEKKTTPGKKMGINSLMFREDIRQIILLSFCQLKRDMAFLNDINKSLDHSKESKRKKQNKQQLWSLLNLLTAVRVDEVETL